ncbi:MAG: PDZ domain-containing protein [Acidobacteria bacterium]|nr:PDZ domain-containing protein [Acidobacteriota bacterium]
MTYRGKFLIAIISALVTFYAFSGVFMGWYDARAQQPINDPGAQIRIFESVLQHIQNDYVDEPNLEKVRMGALRGLAYGLDPYSSYLTAEQVKEYQQNKNAKKAGIGAQFSQFSSYLYVISVTKGSPADKAGIEAGDVIEYVGDKATRDISLYDAEELVSGAPGTSVKLRVLRTGEKPQTISVTRGSFSIPNPVSEVTDGKVGVIKVFSLEKGQGDEIRNQITALKDKGIEKIVLDLRNVADGSIDEAVSVANAFIKDGDLAKVIGREDKVIKTYKADAGKYIFGGNLAVLIDFGSAGGSEVIASAILDHKRGEVVGERSFGAGTAQELFSLRGGDGLLLTTSKWASSAGVAFMAAKRNDSGLMPSVEVKHPETPEPIEVEEMVDPQNDDEKSVPEKEEKAPRKVQKLKNSEDIQLKKAIEVVQGKAKSASA